ERQPVDVLLLGQAHDGRVGVADAGGGALQTHLAGAGLRGLDLHDLRCGADRAVLQCLHSILLLGRLDVPALTRRISAGSAPGMGRRSRFGGYAWPRCSSTRSTFPASWPSYPGRRSALRTRLTRGLKRATASHAALIPGMTSTHSPSMVVNMAVVSFGRPDSRTTRTAAAAASETEPSAVSETVGATEKAKSMPPC